MKKFTSLFVVVLLLAALSVSSLAESQIFGQTTVEDGKVSDVFVTDPKSSWDGIETKEGYLDFPAESTTTYYNTPEETKETMSSDFTWQMDMFFYGTEIQDGNGSVKESEGGKYKPYDSSFVFMFGGEVNQALMVKYNFKEGQYELIYNPKYKKDVLEDGEQIDPVTGKNMVTEKDPSIFERKLIVVKEELTMNEWHTVVFRVGKNGDIHLFVDDQVKLELLATNELMPWGETKDKNTGEVTATFPQSIDPKMETTQKIFRKFNLQLRLDNITVANSEYYGYHTFDESKRVVIPAQEFVDGLIKDTCANCGTVCETVLKKLGCQEHIGGTATCTSKATCTKCGAKYGQMAPHNWDNKVVVESVATSLKEGRSYVTCTDCGAKKYTISIIDPNNPDNSDPIYQDGYIVPGPGNTDPDNNNPGTNDPDNQNPGNSNSNQKPNNQGGTKKDEDKANPGTSDTDLFGLTATVVLAGAAMIIKKRV